MRARRGLRPPPPHQPSTAKYVFVYLIIYTLVKKHCINPFLPYQYTVLLLSVIKQIKEQSNHNRMASTQYFFIVLGVQRDEGFGYMFNNFKFNFLFIYLFHQKQSKFGSKNPLGSSKESFRLPEVSLITLPILFQFLQLAGAFLADLQSFHKSSYFLNNPALAVRAHLKCTVSAIFICANCMRRVRVICALKKCFTMEYQLICKHISLILYSTHSHSRQLF